MKNLFFLILLTSFNSLFAQDAPEKTNCIIISVADSSEKATYKNFSLFLMDNGFTVGESNTDLLFLTTHYKTSGNIKVKLNCSIRGKEIHLSGHYIYSAMEEIAGPIYKSKSKNSAVTRAFVEMDNLAKKYAGGKISYLTKK